MKTVVVVILMIFIVCSSHADIITLHMPVLDESPEQHYFFHELITEALENDGHSVKLVTEKLPQLRIKSYLDKGEISIYWMLESEERNNTYIPVSVALTNGLIGKRILFIREKDQYIYDRIRSLDDFRNLKAVGYMGMKWFDVKVWQANNLRYQEVSGNWKKIYQMISHSREPCYFSRGLNEIIAESSLYPEMAVEKKLVLIYDRDYLFYLSKEGINAGAVYKNVITGALEKARDSGLIDKLVQKYWGDDFRHLDYDSRIKINLKTPE